MQRLHRKVEEQRAEPAGDEALDLRPRCAPLRLPGRANLEHFHGFRFRVQGLGFVAYGLWFMVYGLGCRVQGLGFRVQGSGLRVDGSGLRGRNLEGLGALGGPEVVGQDRRHCHLNERESEISSS